MHPFSTPRGRKNGLGTNGLNNKSIGKSYSKLNLRRRSAIMNATFEQIICILSSLIYFSPVLHFTKKPVTLISNTNQIRGFYMKCNTGLK